MGCREKAGVAGRLSRQGITWSSLGQMQWPCQGTPTLARELQSLHLLSSPHSPIPTVIGPGGHTWPLLQHYEAEQLKATNLSHC